MKYTLFNHQLNLKLEASDSFAILKDLFDYFHLSRSDRYQYLQQKKIRVNGVYPHQATMPLPALALIQINTSDESVDVQPAEKACTVVYEDDFIYVAHKDAGIIVHGDEPITLASQAARYQLNHHINAPVRYIHRLDRDTSGLVLFVKVPFLQPWYDYELSEKRIERIYWAIAKGKMKPNAQATYTDRIGRDRHQSGKYRISSTGKDAKTHVKCLKLIDGYPLLECRLDTGRTHQIRVHLSAHGLPIVNDELYGLPVTRFKGMGLWARELHVQNPITKKEIRILDQPNPIFAE